MAERLGENRVWSLGTTPGPRQWADDPDGMETNER